MMRLLILGLSLCLTIVGNAQTLRVTDDFNRTVTLPDAAHRIISLAPHLSELIFSAGSGDKLIAVSKHCNYPPEVLDLPQVSDYQTISFEQIALLQADLILVWSKGLKSGHLPLLEQLAKQVYVSDPTTVEDIADNLTDIGILSGNAAVAGSKADAFLADMRELERRYHKTTPVPSMYLIWEEPPMVINGEHWISKLIHRCGGQNVYADAPGEIAALNREALLLSPVRLVLTSLHDVKLRFPETAEVVYIEDDFIQRPSLRIAQGAAQVCEAIAGYEDYR